jgi:hypothetical protein
LHVLLLLKFLLRNYCYSVGFTFICDLLLLSCIFQNSPLFYIFSVLTVTCLGEFPSWSCLVGVLKASYAWIMLFLETGKIFCYYSIEYVAYAFRLYLFLLSIWMIHSLDFQWYPGDLACFICTFLVFFLCLYLSALTPLLYIQSLMFTFAFLILLVRLSTVFFIWVTELFISRISILFFQNLYIFTEFLFHNPHCLHYFIDLFIWIVLVHLPIGLYSLWTHLGVYTCPL